MSEFKIERNVPLPPARPGPSRKYHFDEMEIGDSVFIAGKKQAQLSSAVSRWKPKQFTMRRVIENEISGVRIWRIS